MSTKDASASASRGRFYHELVTVKVEETIHRVPKYHLETWSTMFKDMFSLPQGPDSEGSSEENPIVLAGCTNMEFESLMDVLLTPGAIVPLTLTKEQWISVLKLSTVWEIPRARVLSVTKLKTLDIPPTEMVNLGRKYKVVSLFVEGCAALARHDYAPEQLENLAALLGWDFAARIMWITSSRPHHPAAIVGFPRNMAKCLQCAAPLSLMETTEVAARPGPQFYAHGHHAAPHPATPSHIPPPAPPPPMALPQMQPPPGVGPQPAHPQPAPPPLSLISQQAYQQQMMQQQLAVHQAMHQGNMATLQMNVPQTMVKRSLVVKYTCPTPGCRGVWSAGGVRLDMSTISGVGCPGFREVDPSTIEEVFEDEMKDMY